jgi:hypothetical protein
MYFQDAVQELVSGRCTRIKIHGCEYGIIHEHLGLYNENDGSYSCNMSLHAVDYISNEWEVVTPILQYEKVEVVSWKVVSGEMEGTCWDTEAEARRHGNTVVRLVGSYRKELKPKTKYREEIGLCTFGMDVIKRKKVSQYDAKVFIEWEV